MSTQSPAHADTLSFWEALALLGLWAPWVAGPA